jgi:hypothetical protein
MTTIPTSTIDVEGLRKAFADRNAADLAAFYADDAVVELVDAQHTPSDPQRLEGREAIRAHLDDVFSRDMSHDLDIVAASPDALGYSLRCRYADGMRVVCAATAELRDGRIAREVGVQAWDS